MTFEVDSLSYTLLASILGAASLIAIKNGNYPDVHPLILNSQSEVSQLRHPGESAVLKSKLYPGGAPLISSATRTAHTLRDFYEVAFHKHKSNTFLGAINNNRFSWNTYNEAFDRIRYIFNGLVRTFHLMPSSGKEDSFVGIYASTSPESFMTEIACHWGGLVTIPIAAQATISHVTHVIRSTSLKLLVIDEGHLDFVLSFISETTIKYIVVIGDSIESSTVNDILIVPLEKIVAEGEDVSVDVPEITPNSIASIYYSNSLKKQNDHDDNPGVVLTQKNLISAISSYMVHPPLNKKPSSKDRLMHSFTISNVLGYVLEAMICFAGGSIAFENKVSPDNYDLDIPSILSTIKSAGPTIYASGAPFLNQVKKMIENTYGKSFLFQSGMERKQRYFKEGRLVSDCIYDILVFRGIKHRMFGGNVRLILSDDDDEPTSNLALFYRSVLGCHFIKTFGSLETCGAISASPFFDYLMDERSIGAPLACTELKLVDVDKTYTAEDYPNPRGEIFLRGSCLFAGYWGDIKKSFDSVDPDGWFSANYIGELLPNGSILVLERKKNSNSNSNIIS